MNINLKPMFLMSKYSIPAMINSGNGGVIINISSISATIDPRVTHLIQLQKAQ